MDNDWNNPSNWTPGGPPNGPSDTATFSFSTGTEVSIYADTELDGITFSAGASPYTITVTYPNGVLTVSGAGIINNSGVMQNLMIDSDLFFTNNATAGDVTLTASGDIEFDGNSTAGSASFPTPNGFIQFYDASNAGNGTFEIDGFQFCGGGAAEVEFAGTASAGNAVFTVNSGAICGSGGGGFMYFTENSTAGNGIFTFNGAADAGERGGLVVFQGNDDFTTPTAGNATLIANGGSNGGPGGSIQFWNYSLGGTPRVEVFNNGDLDISSHINNFVPTPVTIGSIEGTGAVFLGENNLTVGSNNLSTTFSGTIQDQGGINFGTGGSVTKIGTGTLTLSGGNTYTGGTTVSEGTLLITNRRGSGTGTGAVQVSVGTLGGTGKIAGTMTVGTGSGTGAFLAPGATTNTPGKLTIQKKLTFKANSTYQYGLKTSNATADQVVAKGVTINTGAQFSFTAIGNGALTTGTVFTAINNTAATPIRGTFSNLPDGSTFTDGPNTYLVNYEGGTGNDLTLTVQ